MGAQFQNGQFQVIIGNKVMEVDLFLQDLKEYYPQLFENIFVAQQNRIKNLQSFFQSGMDENIFNRIHIALSLVQDDASLRRIMEPTFSIQWYDLTLKQAVMEYYKMKQYQVIRPDYLDTVDDSGIEKEIIRILQTIS
ncbi:hypothetical protein [Niallia taxi]|uniref:hypothetical protein n=1 Tax=Niallia taxi TaxID=2499688 RepID=UPI002E206E5B|nr:hypothetical protein [Niallia taxi]